MKSHEFSTALITGASYGIGKALAHLLAEEGIQLILAARSTARLQELARDLSRLVPVEVAVCDLGRAEKRKELIKTVRSRAPDLIVNNAGFGLYGDVLTYSTAEQKEMVEVDVMALMELTIEGARALVAAGKKGVVMNVSSAAAFQVFPAFSVYSAAKAFVNQFSESFDFETAPSGVRILTCCPGMVDTNFRYRASGNQAQEPMGISMDVDFAAKEIWGQIQKRKRMHIFDWKYRILTGISRLLPKAILAKAMQYSIKRRFPKRDLLL